MGTEISEYQAATVAFLAARLPGIPIYERSSGSLRRTEEGWGIEIGVVMASILGHDYNTRAQIAVEASIRYVEKTPPHARYAEALDIASTVGALLVHQRIHVPSHVAGEELELAHGVAVRDVQIVTEPETAIIGRLLQPTGGYRVSVQWEDELVIEPELVYDGRLLGVAPEQPHVIEDVVLVERIEGQEARTDRRVELHPMADTAQTHFGAMPAASLDAFSLQELDLQVESHWRGVTWVADLTPDTQLFRLYWAVDADSPQPAEVWLNGHPVAGDITTESHTEFGNDYIVYWVPRDHEVAGTLLSRFTWELR